MLLSRHGSRVLFLFLFRGRANTYGRQLLGEEGPASAYSLFLYRKINLGLLPDLESMTYVCGICRRDPFASTRQYYSKAALISKLECSEDFFNIVRRDRSCPRMSSCRLPGVPSHSTESMTGKCSESRPDLDDMLGWDSLAM